MLQSQNEALREYVNSLERQNHAKSEEQVTLYRQIQNLSIELSKMETYYYKHRELQQQVQVLQDEQNKRSYEYNNIMCSMSQNKDLMMRISMLEQQLRESVKTAFELRDQISRNNYQQKELTYQIGQFRMELDKSKNEIQRFKEEIQRKDYQIRQLVQKIKEYESNSQSYQDVNVEELIKNYQKIESVVMEKDERMQEMQEYINQIQYQCQSLTQELTNKEVYQKQLEAKIQYLKHNIKMSKIIGDVSEQNSQHFNQPFSKIQLIRNSNKMIERINQLEKQNNGNALNRSDSQRFAMSECGQEKAYSNSPSKLQMRIQALKMENQNLLRNLAI